jgi:hypothetical protein
MKHDQYKELLHLTLYHELGEDEQKVLQEHMKTCSECQTEFAELEKLESVLSRGQRFEVSDALLDEARRELRVVLRLERSKRPFWSEWLERFDLMTSPGLRVALGGVATLVVGLSLGYLIFAPPAGVGTLGTLSTVSRSNLQQSDTRVSNFHLHQQAAEGGEVEFSFDMVTPIRMRGNINDNAVQRIMAQALVNDQNPGARILTASALASHVESSKAHDKEIKTALIQALRSDPNIGVRKEALKAMQNLPLDQEIKDVLLYVLKYEANPSMRIDVINYLEKPVLSGRPVDQDILNGLKDRMQSDNNNYIRLRARNVYEEVNQQ